MRITLRTLVRPTCILAIAMAAMVSARASVAGARDAAAVSATPQEHPIQAELSRSPSAQVAAGGMFTATLRADIPTGWHLYSLTQPPGGPIPTTIEIARGAFRLGGPVDGPVPVSAPDPNFGITSEWYEDSAVFHLPIRVSETAAGSQKMTVYFGYQTCTSRYCLPPRVDTMALSIPVSGRIAAATQAADSPAAGTPAPGRVAIPQEQLDANRAAAASTGATTASAPEGSGVAAGVTTGARSFILFLWVAFSMGALALLTPCVFPMIPITISYFSQRKSGGSALGEAALYAIGIMGSFTIAGLGLSLVFGVTGLNRFAASAPLNLAVAGLFIVFALSLFGILNLAIPASLLNRVDRAGRGREGGRAGTTLLMGATFALTTFTCTAPFVGTLLVSAASGDWRWPAAGLFAFSSAFALPFFVLALVPNALARLPRSGDWLITMKGALAFIELAAAMKFLSNADLVQGWGIFTRNVVIGVWVGLGLALSLYLFGVRSSRWFWRAGAKWHPIAGTLALATAAWLTTGLAGRRLGEVESFLPPAGGSGVAANELEWMRDDYQGALRQAAIEQKPVLIDFTGFTCTNCRWMEANMFPRDAVQEELQHFVRVRLFTDGADTRYREQQDLERNQFQTVALPLYAVVDATGAKRATFLGMTRSPEEFIRFLSDARSKP